MKELICIILCWLFPYALLGEEAGAYFFVFLLSIYIFMRKKEACISGNIIYMGLLLAMTVWSGITIFLSVNPLRSLYGVSLCIAAVLTYLAAKQMKEEYFIKYSVYVIATFAMVTIVYQGVLQQIRIYGNFGYANTYALTLFIAFIFSEIWKDKKLDFYTKLTLVVALLFTGDRVTTILLIAWAIYCSIKDKKPNVILNVALAMVQYALFAMLGVVSLLLAPLTIVLLQIMYQLLLKINKKIMFLLVPIMFIVTLLVGTNTSMRLLNINLQNASLVERMISFVDVIKQVPVNVFGKGANSYEYSQYLQKSAFYESKYMHNAFLQYLYDFGFIGAVLFAVIIFYGLYMIITSTNSRKQYYSIVYIAICIHGMMNFDMVFATVWMVVVVLVSFCSEKKEFSFTKAQIQFTLIVLCVGAIPFSVYEASLRIADTSIKEGHYNVAKVLLNIPRTMKLPDERIYFMEAVLEKEKQTTLSLHNAEENLKKAEHFNHIDPRIKWNLAFVLTKQKKYEEAEKLWKEVLQMEGYHKEAYKAYYQFLEEAYGSNIEEKEKKMKELVDVYNAHRDQLHEKAHLLPNQLKDTLQATLVE